MRRFVLVAIMAMLLLAVCGGDADDGQSSPTLTSAPTLTPRPLNGVPAPTVESIDVRAIFESIEERNSAPSLPFFFGPWDYEDLTGDGRPEALVSWGEGGSCGISPKCGDTINDV